MKKTVLILMALILAVVPFLACGEAAEKEHNFLTFTSSDGEVYDLFVITKLNYGEDHKVTSVTGHFERVVKGEDYDESETAPGSEVTYPLAADFSAYMVGNTTDMGDYVTVTDLYAWYLDAYIGRENYDGHELVYTCDQTPEEQEMGTADFWFVTTRIELNANQEIQYMEYIYVSWA